jgi:hypothetical protein
MWLLERPPNCLVKSPEMFTTSAKDFWVNETCIHKTEFENIRHSNDQGLQVKKDLSECDSSQDSSFTNKHISEDEQDRLPKFLANKEEVFPEVDPHFPVQASNAAIPKFSFNRTHLNRAIIFKVDESGNNGEKIRQVCERINHRIL